MINRPTFDDSRTSGRLVAPPWQSPAQHDTPLTH
jgi:hypothetical protein